MVKISKSPIPEILEKNAKQWTEELLALIAAGSSVPDSVRGRYRHTEIKTALKQDSSEKCIYCESKVSAVYFGDVEHMKPKDQYPESTFDWANLGYVCALCNNKKSNIFDESVPFINPYTEQPTDFLKAAGAYVFHLPANKRGEITELTLELNRPELIERRKERIDLIRSLADKIATEQNATLKALLINEVKKELADDKPYAMVTRAIFEALPT
jgi:hypothetical protein